MRIISLCLFLVVAATSAVPPPTAQAQSKSMRDWPAWQKAAVVTVASTSGLVTTLVVGLGNAESDSGESQSGLNQQDKGQGYVQEMQDELLAFVAVLRNANADSVPENSITELLDAYAGEFPLLSTYYTSLVRDHPEVVARLEDEGSPSHVASRLNEAMLTLLFTPEPTGASSTDDRN